MLTVSRNIKTWVLYYKYYIVPYYKHQYIKYPQDTDN